MRITGIESQRKNPRRKSIFADGKFLIGVSDETLLRFTIRVGDEIGEEKLEALRAADELQSAKTAALRFLAPRPRSIREVRDKLREKEFAEADIENAIGDLSRAGLLNDEEFARSYIRNQLAIRPKGTLILKQKLLLLGINKEMIDRALGEIFSETHQDDVALIAARSFLKKSHLDREEPRKRRQKLMAFLSRRGFTWDIVSNVTRIALGTAPLGEKDDDE